ncbi:MAG: HAD-IA family hydrolase [Actinomycetota bacterium]|nr:HAD-IA family hydrolase [Actinomycetota bacterium]
MLRALCLDLMDTVVHDPYVVAVEAATGLDLETVHRLRDPTSWPAFEVGDIDESAFVRRYFADPGGPHRFDLEAFHAARRDGCQFLPGMAQLLDDLAGRIPRYLASNYPVWIEELRRGLGLDRRFEGVYASHHLGVRKPDRAFYERLLAEIGQPAQSCLFVDDDPANCRAAEAVGMRVHRFDGSHDLRQRLRSEGVLPATSRNR